MNPSIRDAACANDPGPRPTYRASFIVRCWINTANEVHTRLIDVRSGNGYPLANLADLPDVIGRLLFHQPICADEQDVEKRPATES